MGNGHYVMMDSKAAPNLTLDWFDPVYWANLNAVTGQAKGRGTTLFIQVDNQALVLRHYKRGGLPGKVLSDQYLYAGLEKTRAFREFRLLWAMREQGLCVPHPIAVHVKRQGCVYRGDLITAMIPHSEDLHAVLCRQPLSSKQWHAVGKAVARMHKAGVYHHDLNVRNIMVDTSGKVWIIDFDRCRFRQGDKWKSQNIARFLRSLEKEKAKYAQFFWQNAHWASFLEGLNEA